MTTHKTEYTHIVIRTGLSCFTLKLESNKKLVVRQPIEVFSQPHRLTQQINHNNPFAHQIGGYLHYPKEDIFITPKKGKEENIGGI